MSERHQRMAPPRGLSGAGVALAALLLCLHPGLAQAQLAKLVSPGPLSKAHASIEGIDNCQKCHEPGRRVTPDKCLTCHQPIAERIRARKGVHRNAGDTCVTCHIDHAGVDADIRPFDTKRFDHAADTAFPLDGRHAPLAADCARCHKGRSFLTARPACSSCHADPHKPSLGQDCTACHSAARPFADALKTFDHSRAAFPLTGAHITVACERCHAKKTFKGVRFATCADCHRSPHRQTLGDACTTCHTADGWKTKKIDHARTGFPLRGRHAPLECVKCHVKPATEVHLKFARCADCHADVHRGAFKQDCTACHNETGFGGAPFDHRTTAFPLDGRHAPLACSACHKGASGAGRAPTTRAVEFKGLSTACSSCHTDPHRSELGTRCEQCHTSATFKVGQFTHPRAPEFYAGQHAGVSCAACHIAEGPRQPRRTGVPVDGWKFKNLPVTCSSCHTDPHLGQLGSSCETCHTIATAKFRIAGFDHARAKFALAGQHATVQCERCHKQETGVFPAGSGTAIRFRGLSTDCAACHKDPHLGQLGTRCEQCHSAASFKVTGFTHTGNQKLFVAKHATLSCTDCHKREDGQFPAGRGNAVRYKGFGATCASCHTDPHGGAFGSTCEQCHAPDAWKTVSRAFHKVTQLPLEGRHLMAECSACHVAGVMKGTPTRCYDCHWVRRQDDRYRTRLGNECEQCHRPTSWLAVNWNHGAVTGVPLSPVHRALGCDACHKEATFKGSTPTCVSCHQEEYQRTSKPNHASAGFPTACDLCHRPAHATWSQASFNHSAFPLVGPHATQTCSACHKGNVYRGTPRDCYSCHRADYDRSQNPSHIAAGFPTSCDTCHRPTDAGWKGSFNHNSFFPLVGLHATQACLTCHVGNRFRGTPTDCYGCHRADYQRSQNPNHAAAGFPTTCESCHQASSPDWRGTFTHNTVFALVGRHATSACTACHVNSVFRGTPRDCYGCHQTQYTQTRNPNHAAAGFPTSCESCHQPSSPDWRGTFNHNSVFALVGRHATQACSACHVNSVFRGTPRDCYSCHRDDYQRSQNPNHTAAGFPTSCESCHQPSSPDWRGTFNHNSVFALVGRHATQACATCHVNGVYRGTPRDCYGCHRADYQRSQNPNHAAGGFPTTCESCHQPSSPDWRGSFNHSTFALVGRHTTQPCSACHRNNVYRGTPRDCFGCHQTQYTQTRNPNHAATGFPTGCEACHRATDNSWNQGTFNHTWFPITSGRHAGNPCSACHTNPSNYRTFTCLTCHDRGKMDREHSGRRGYVYESQACYSCHPTGRAD